MMSTSLERDTIADDTSHSKRGTDGDCGQIISAFALQAPQLNLVPAKITHQDRLLQPSGVQPLTSPLPLPFSPTECSPLSTSAHDRRPSTTVSLASSSVTHPPPPAAPSSPLPPPQNGFSTINHPLPSTVTSVADVSPPSDPAQYFRNKVGSEDRGRIDRLLQATQRFIASTTLNQNEFTTLLALWSGSFDESGSKSISRLQRLAYAKTEHDFAEILYIIYLAHEIDLLAKSESVKLGRCKGVRRQTAAFSKAAEALGKSEKAVKADYRKYRNYKLLIQSRRPGLLLRIGSGVATIWQHRLVAADIPLLIDYWDYLQQLDDQADAIDDGFASQILIDGMVAFGWTHHELAATDSELTYCLRRHKDLDQLARDMSSLVITQPLRYSGTGEGLGAPVGSIWEKQARTEGNHELGQHKTAWTVPSLTARSPAQPITLSTWPDQINRCYSGGNVSQSFRAANQSTNTLNAANIRETSPRNDLGTPLAQNNTWSSRAESLGVVAPHVGASCGSFRHEADYRAIQRQNIQEALRDETRPVAGVSPEKFIPPLFYAMGDHIPKVMLDRAISLQPRWSEHGEFCEITPHGAGLHRDLVDLLSDDATLKQSIERLISLSIVSEVSRDGLQVYICRDKAAEVSYDQNRAYWTHRAFELCCYVFPRSQILDSSFSSVGKQLLFVLQHLLRLYAKAGLEIPPKKDAVEALLAASKFGGLSNGKYLLSKAAELQKDPEQTDLRAMIIHRESVLLRYSKKISDSQRVIQQFLDRPFPVTNPRSHCLLGLLHLSQAENWAYKFSYRKVYEEAQKWEPDDNPTAMQLWILRTKLSVLGQSYKGDGLFEEAQSAFEGCLAAMKPCDSERYLIKSNLADVYCELDYLKRKESVIRDAEYLEEAEKIVSPELDHLRTRTSSSKASRRLLLSLIEIEILRRRHIVAESLIRELLEIYNGLSEPDTNDQVGHVRTLIAWARISVPCEAVARWHTAYLWNKLYNPFEEDVFTCGAIYLFISLAYFRIGDEHGSRASFDRASEVISTKKPQFLMPGVGTYLYSFARRELWSATGWQLPGVPP